MTTTRVVRFHRPVGPEVLQVDEIPLAKSTAGEVLVRAKQGPRVSTLSVGDKVSSIPAAPMAHYGNRGETAIYPADALIKYPSRLSPEQAAPAAAPQDSPTGVNGCRTASTMASNTSPWAAWL